MRKVLTILALMAIAIGVSARTASADGVVDYTVTGTWGAVDGFPSTSLSNTGDSFTFTFSVDPASLGAGPLGDQTGAIPITIDYTDFLGGTTNYSFTGQAGTVTLYSENFGGLFDLEFITPGGADFFLQLYGLDAGFNDGTPPTLNTGGPFAITPGDNLGDGSLMADITNLGVNSVTSGTVTATERDVPEPSSLLLLASGLIALGAFARKRMLGVNN